MYYDSIKCTSIHYWCKDYCTSIGQTVTRRTNIKQKTLDEKTNTRYTPFFVDIFYNNLMYKYNISILLIWVFLLLFFFLLLFRFIYYHLFFDKYITNSIFGVHVFLYWNQSKFHHDAGIFDFFFFVVVSIYIESKTTFLRVCIQSLFCVCVCVSFCLGFACVVFVCLEFLYIFHRMWEKDSWNRIENSSPI